MTEIFYARVHHYLISVPIPGLSQIFPTCTIDLNYLSNLKTVLLADISKMSVIPPTVQNQG
jgi:hypothetical protein